MKEKTAKAANPKPRLISSKIGKSDQVVIPVSNLPMSLDYAVGVPGPRNLEVFRLKNRVKWLDRYSRALNDQISFLLQVLGEEQRVWKLGLEYEQWPTLGKALELLRRIESAISREGRMLQIDKEFEDAVEKFLDSNRRPKLLALQCRLERVKTNFSRLESKSAKIMAVKPPRYLTSETDADKWLENKKARLDSLGLDMVKAEVHDIRKEVEAIIERVQ